MAREVISMNEVPGVSRVRWGAVFAGLFIALVSQVLLGLLGLAVGLSTFNPATFTGFGVGSGVWLIISTLISVFLGAWAASWWANTIYRADGILHGVLTWSLYLVVTLFFIGSGVGTLLGGAFNLVSSGLTGVSQGAATNVAYRGVAATERQASVVVSQTDIDRRLTQLLAQQGPNSRVLARLNTSPQVKAQIVRQIAAGNDTAAARIITAHTGISQADALNLVQGSRIETRQVARRVTQRVTGTAGKVAWWAFFAVLLSLIAAGLGGLVGAKSTERFPESLA